MTTYSTVLRDSDEIEHFFLAQTGMKPGYLQLSRGRADLRVEVADLAGVTLIWARAQTRARWRDEMTGDGLHIGFAVESEGSITARGRSIGADAGQVWMPGKEMDLIMGGANLTLDLAVERDLVEQLGWQFQGDPIRRVSQSHLARLLRSCRRATKAARGLPARPAAGVDVELWRDQVLDQLEPVLAPWLVASDEVASSLISATSNYALVRRADAYIEGFGFDAPFQIDLLAETLGVPRRSLFHAYRQVLGIGPRQYFELRRLHRFRARLRQAGACSATVTSIATELGFSDLGRLAGSYRRQFGENPSDTLKLVRRSDGR